MKKALLLVPVLMLFAHPVAAQDIEAMAKWTAYQIVHYKVIGEFSGESILLKGSGQTSFDTVTARVTDRIEIEYDWDQQEYKVVGKPIIRNFPTKLVSINLEIKLSEYNKIITHQCPEPKLSGAIEYMTGLGLKPDEAMNMSGAVLLEVRRDHPGGSFGTFFPPAHPGNNTRSVAKCGEFWETAKPFSETSTMGVMAPPAMYLAMPFPPGQGGMKLSADKKSMILTVDKPGATGYGWTWTVTPTGVK